MSVDDRSDGRYIQVGCVRLIAESDPKEKDVMVALVMNLLRLRGGE